MNTPPETTQPATPPPTVLIVDDDPSVRLGLQALLEDEGFSVMAASSGAEGLSIFASSPPDLVLVDLTMPDMHGRDVVRHMHGAAPLVPVIVVSGTGLLEDAVGTLRDGAWDYVAKPIANTPGFVRLIRRALERARLLAENTAYSTGLEQMVRQRTAELEAASSRLHTTLFATVGSLSKLTNLKDAYTEAHQRRVAIIATTIGEVLGFEGERLDGLRVAATLHDIGKLCIPSEFLTKPSSLDSHEMAFLRQHPQFGHEILADIPFFSPVADIVLQHHERLDGSGYPARLQGDAILPEARIIAVADVLEAICSHRPYRPALPLSYAMSEIESGMGTLFCPQAAGVCLDLVRSDDPRLHAFLSTIA